MESRIQSTCDDAVRAKTAAVRAGYFKDPFIAAFHSDARSVQPLIKRGTFARVVCVERAISSFLRLSVDSGTSSTSPQVVVLGAGKDTAFFRLQAGLIESEHRLEHRIVSWFDVDYPAIVASKLEALQRSEDIFRARLAGRNERGGITLEASGDPRWSGSYHFVPHDLRGDIELLIAALETCGYERTSPTLFISECCLMYLPEHSTRCLLKGLAESCQDSYIFFYEPILGSDQFGNIMKKNLLGAGVVDNKSNLIKSITLNQHLDKLAAAGFDITAGCDMWTAFETLMTPEQRRHANECEFLDEIEEWVLIMRHYCMIVASTSKSTFGKEFCAAVRESSVE